MSIDASQAARALRAIPSEKRTEASRMNGQAGGRPQKLLSEIDCSCEAGETMEGHKSTCKRGRAIKRREAKGLPLE